MVRRLCFSLIFFACLADVAAFATEPPDDSSCNDVLHSEIDQLRRQLQNRLGRPQEFIQKKKIAPETLLVSRTLDIARPSGAEFAMGLLSGREVLLKIFWHAPKADADEISGAIIQDFLAELEFAPKVFGLILDPENFPELKNSDVLSKTVRGHMHMVLVMEFIPDSFNIPNGTFLPPWYVTLSREAIAEQVTRMESFLATLGIRRSGGEFLLTPSRRLYAIDFTGVDFNAD